MKKIHPKSMSEPMMAMPAKDHKTYPVIEIPIEQIPELQKKAPGDVCEIKLHLKVTGVRTGKGEWNNRLTAELHGYEASKEYSKGKKSKAPRYEEEED